MQLLQGQVAGLNIQNNNGTPGMMGTILIRGISNINVQGTGDQALLTPTSPLFVIDGIPIEDPSQYEYGFNQAGPGLSPLSLIPPEDIADITVLKDAQATSLYGSQGAYGVILITTKRGESEVPIISYSSDFFVSTPPQLRDVIIGRGERMSRIHQIIQYDTSAVHAYELVNQTAILSDSLNPYYNNATDWQRLFYRTTYNQSHNINASGGDQEFNYKVNANFYDSKGIVDNTGFTRYSLSMNMGYRPTEKFNLSAYINTSLGKNSKGSGNALAQTGIAQAANTTSLLPSPSLYTASNETLGAVSIDNDNKTVGVSASVNLSYELFNGLRLNTATGYNYSTGTEDTFYPSLLQNDNARVFAYNRTSESLYNRSSIQFNKTINDAHNFGIYLNETIRLSNSKSNTITQVGLPNDEIWGPFGYNAALSYGSADAGVESRSVSFAGSFSYSYKSKYVADFSYRLSGSSSQGPEVPWTKSPSVGIRWNLHNEKFLEPIDWLSFSSMRASWGQTIIPEAGVYDIYGRYITNPFTYNNQETISIELGNLPNTALVPSTSTMWNFGVDLGFFSSRYGVSFDTYYRQTDKILRRKTIADINAFAGVNTNETSIVNYGYELSFNAHILPATSKWDWTIAVNGAWNKDVLAKLPDNDRQIFNGGEGEQPVVNRLGGNSLSNYLFHSNGVYTDNSQIPVDPLTGLPYRNGGTLAPGRFFREGDPIWTDINGDYILDDNDRVIVGNSQPRVTGGLSSNVRYGPFSFSTSASITLRRDIINSAIAERFQSFSDPMSENALVPIDAYDFYTRDNPSGAGYPDPYDFTRYALYTPFRPDQTLFQEDGSYIKINSIGVSYNFDRDWTEAFGISSARINATANNIYTFSKYSGPNPESVSGLGRDSSGGYPNSRDYSIGLNIQF